MAIFLHNYIAICYNFQVILGGNMKIFQERLIELRKSSNLTQRQLASYLGISQPSYVRYENGSAEPTFEKLVMLADYFEVSIDYLLGRTEI